MSSKAADGQRWLEMLSRTCAAILGGYAFTYAATAAIARALPLANVDAVVVATLLSFTLYTLAVLWAFAARTAWRAWAVIPLAVPLALIGFWPQLLEYLK